VNIDMQMVRKDAIHVKFLYGVRVISALVVEGY